MCTFYNWVFGVFMLSRTFVDAQGTPASQYFLTRPTRFNGLASNYGGPADGGWGDAIYGLCNGGCGYGNIHDARLYPRRAAIAFDPTSPAIAGIPSFGCGTCWKITNPTGRWPAIVAMVTDICPECNAKHNTRNGVDVDFLTWTGLVENKALVGQIGLVPVILEQVNCRPDGSMKLFIMDFTGPWQWIRLIPKEVAGIGVVTSISLFCPYVMKPSARWIALDNVWGTVFEAKRNVVPFYKSGTTCRFTVTSMDRQVLQSPWVHLDTFRNGGTIDMKQNFKGSYKESTMSFNHTMFFDIEI